MAIVHTVVFRLIHEPGSDAETEFLDTAQSTLTSIPGVEHFTISRQVSLKSELTWLFSMVFADQIVHDAYNAHPAHLGFVEGRWVPEVAEFQKYDFEAALAERQP